MLQYITSPISSRYKYCGNRVFISLNFQTICSHLSLLPSASIYLVLGNGSYVETAVGRQSSSVACQTIYETATGRWKKNPYLWCHLQVHSTLSSCRLHQELAVTLVWSPDSKILLLLMYQHIVVCTYSHWICNVKCVWPHQTNYVFPS